ncbi:MAG: YeiH family protein [Planctomycetes bacterium]|nr:YeiH family protein [Planctomycetota bacterium]
MTHRLAWIPGVMFASLFAAGALQLAAMPLFHDQLHMGALLLVILLGMAWRLLLPLPMWALPGLDMAKKPILRWAVAGLGLRLTLGELGAIGMPALVIVSVSTLLALFVGWWLGRVFGLSRGLSSLLGVGGAICGASAIVAADTVVQAKKEDSAMAIGIITLLGTLGIVFYPEIGVAVGLNDFDYGVWAGASLHETAQVVAAGDSISQESKEVATVVKLVRICWLAPIVMYLVFRMRREGKNQSHTRTAKVPWVPWFLVMFVVFAAVRSFKLLPEEGLLSLEPLSTGFKWLMCAGMAGVGLHTNLRELLHAGPRPLLVGTLQWALLAGVSLALVRCL